MEIDWGPPGSTSRSFETSVAELRDPHHNYNVTANATIASLSGGTAALSGGGGTPPAGAWMMLAVVAAAACLLSSPHRGPVDARHRRGRQIREAALRRRQRLEERQKRRSRVPDLQQRRQLIDDSLEIQRVTASHGDVLKVDPVEEVERTSSDEEKGGACDYGDYADSQGLPHLLAIESTVEDGEDDANQTSVCAICLEPFEVGQIVAWSRPKKPHHEPGCAHVFHR